MTNVEAVDNALEHAGEAYARMTYVHAYAEEENDELARDVSMVLAGISKIRRDLHSIGHDHNEGAMEEHREEAGLSNEAWRKPDTA